VRGPLELRQLAQAQAQPLAQARERARLWEPSAHHQLGVVPSERIQEQALPWEPSELRLVLERARLQELVQLLGRVRWPILQARVQALARAKQRLQQPA